MDKTIFRCSSLGDIMTSSRSKTDPLSETCKKHLLSVHIAKKYGRYKEIDSKYFAKGTIAEDASISMLSKLHGKEYFKNDEYLKNDFIKGIPDVIDDIIIEIKTPWDIFTFFNAKNDKLNKNYYWACQGYMALTGLSKAVLAYCLVDTPEFLIKQEKKKLSYNMDVVNNQEEYFEKCEKLDKQMKYSDIPLEEKVYQVEIDYNQDDVNSLFERIELCRTFLKAL